MPQKLFIMCKTNSLIFFIFLLAFNLGANASANDSLLQPDLFVRVIDKQQGLVEIKNIGKAEAQASKLSVICSTYLINTYKSRPCAAGLHLPNYTEKYNLLVYPVPALPPGKSYTIRLFGPNSLPHRPGTYGMKVLIDEAKRIAESNEKNNYTRLDTTVGGLPDLIPEAVDLFSGRVRVMNAGGTAAGASKLVLSCSKKGQKGGCPTSATLESMYDFKRGGYVISVPPLPARKSRLVVFPMWYLKWEKGQYTFSLTADATNEIHESSEGNNLVRNSQRWGDSGTLRITALSNGKPAPVTYQIIASGRQTTALGAVSKPEGENIQTPVTISLVPGTYKLNLRAANARAAEQQLDIKIESGKVLEQTFTFQPPGLLKVEVLSGDNEELSRIGYSIYSSDEPHKGVDGSHEGEAPPYKVSLLPGKYDLHVYRKLSRYNGPKKPTTDISLVMGLDEEQVIRGINIQPGQTVEKKIAFKHIEPGILNLHVLCDGKPNGSYVNFSSTEKNSPTLFSFDMPTQLKLAPGRYKLNIHPADTYGSSFQNSGYGAKIVEIVIHAGETLEKQVTFTKAKKGTLVLTVLVNGSRSKAEIGVRRSGKGSFNNMGSSYNLLNNKASLLPGKYDFSIWPMEHHLSPGGIATYHQAGVTLPSIQMRRMTGVEPIILQGIQIKPGETLDKTVKFETKH